MDDHRLPMAGGSSPQPCAECAQRWIHLRGCSRFGEPVPRVGGPELDRLALAVELAESYVLRGERPLQGLTMADACREVCPVLKQAQQRAEGLLLRCEANLPPHLHALLADVRAYLGIDARGQRVDPEHKG